MCFRDRPNDTLRSLHIVPHFAPHADGSVLVECGGTRVICAAMWEDRIPSWMIRQNDTSRGWISAEYSLLPYSTQERKPRDRGQGKTDGRVVEIQRLVGRSLRAVADLSLIKGRTLWIDCDVLQADGGTRTASINGAYLAARLAVRKRLGQLFMGPVAAISVGMVAGEPVLDLNYEEDRRADVDFNVVMDDRDRFIEIQGTAEGNPFSQKNLEDMLELARKGIREIMDYQKAFLETVD